jgi:hypothetical protein
MRTLVVGAALLTLALGSAAFAQQEGLVNVNVEGVNVQVPVAVAAQVCDVNINVIAEQYRESEEPVCTIDQETAAEAGIDTGGGEDDEEDAG